MPVTTAAARRQPQPTVLLLIVAVVLLVAVVSGNVAGATTPPVQLTAAFDRGARLGEGTVLHVDLRIDLRQAPSPIAEMQLLYPAAVGITTSGLGIAACKCPASDFEDVAIDGGGCPRNAVLGRGIARAQIRIGDEPDPLIVPERGRVAILSGGIDAGRLQLVTLVQGDNPIGALLAYRGEARSAPAPFGDSLWIRVPQIPPIYAATVALQRLTVDLGDVVYHKVAGDPDTAYRPDGIQLPSRCPRGGFQFGVRLTLTDHRQLYARTATPCPPSIPPPRRRGRGAKVPTALSHPAAPRPAASVTSSYRSALDDRRP